MIAADRPGVPRQGLRRFSLGRLSGLPAAAGLAVLALTSIRGLHQAAGVLLVAALVWAAYGVVVRLFPGLDAVPALLLAAMLGLSLVALLTVAVYAATVPLGSRSTVITVGAVTAVLVVLGEALGRAPAPLRWWTNRRTVTVAVLTAAACGLLVTDAGAVTARLAPRSHPEPYSSFSFAGPAARWSQELAVSPGQVVDIPLQIVNRSGHRDRFTVQSEVGGAAHTLATVDLDKSATWTATFPVALPESGCPTRLAFYARSAAATETLDVWLQWNDPSCA